MLNKINILLNTKQKKQLYVLLFLVLTASLLEMIGVGSIPVFLGLLLDQSRTINLIQDIAILDFFTDLSYKNQIIYTGIFLLLFFTIKNIFLFFVNLYQSKLTKDLNVENAKRLFQKYIYSSYTSLLKKNPAFITRNISGDILNANIHIITLVNLIREILLIIVIFFLLVWVDFFSTLLIFVLMSFFVIIFYFFVRTKIKELSLLNQSLRGFQIKLINQIFGSIKETKIYSKENAFEKVFSSSTEGIEKINFFSSVISKIPRLLIEVFFIIGILTIIFISIIKNNEINSLIPTLTFLGVAVIRLMPAFSSLTALTNALKKTEPSFNLVTDEMIKHKKASDYNSESNQMTKNKNLFIKNFDNKNIIFNDVFFKYDRDNNYCLKSLNIQINAKQMTAIVGQTGSGKTTLINLILGLLSPSKGKIFIGDFPMLEKIKDWHNQISLVPQDIYLLDDTIKNNIIFDADNKEINKENFDRALEKAKIKNFISELPLKEETIVGNQGIRLSGGQKQRIGIARALYRNKKILILDEATSALDMETEKKLLDDLLELKNQITLIVVTHRVNILNNFDKIFLIKDGNALDYKKTQKIDSFQTSNK